MYLLMYVVQFELRLEFTLSSFMDPKANLKNCFGSFVGRIVVKMERGNMGEEV